MLFDGRWQSKADCGEATNVDLPGQCCLRPQRGMPPTSPRRPEVHRVVNTHASPMTTAPPPDARGILDQNHWNWNPRSCTLETSPFSRFEVWLTCHHGRCPGQPHKANPSLLLLLSTSVDCETEVDVHWLHTSSCSAPCTAQWSRQRRRAQNRE